MANGRYDYDDEEQVQRVPKKADVILQRQQAMALKQDDAIAKVNAANARIDDVMAELAKVREESAEALRRNEELFGNIGESVAALRRELKYLAAQNESIFNSVSEKIEKLDGEVNKRIIPEQPAEEEAAVAEAVAEPVQAEIDYETLAAKVAERIEVPAPQVISDGVPVQTIVQESAEIDYDVLVDKIIARLPVQETAVAAAPAVSTVSAVPVYSPVEVTAEVDYDLIADKVISRIPVQEVVSPDYIASKVAEQLIVPEAAAVAIDYDALAEKVAEKIPAPQVVSEGTPVQTIVHENTEIDYEQLAELISEYMPVQETVVEQSETEIDYEALASKVAERITVPEVAAAVANTEIDEEELADRIALKIGAVQPRDYDILVDEDGCSTITKEITDKLDYELIASTVAEKLRVVLDTDGESEQTDYEEMAARISENITVAGVNEDAIAEKAAAVLSNYLPEFDTDEIADKVAAQIISAIPAAEVDSEAISNAVAEKLNERQAEIDYDIVLDEEGLERVSASVSENVAKTTEERFNAVESEIAELKTIIENGVNVNDTPDYEEMASRISENITVAGVDEDAIAQKAAAVLSEYVYDTDEIATKVADKVIENLPAVNNEEIADTVADKVIVAMPVPAAVSEENPEYNVVIDENGINEVTERVTQGTEERFDAIDREIAEIKRLLENGAYVVATVPENDEIAAEACEEIYEEEPEEEQLVTVSDVIAEEPEETEEIAEEVEEETVEEVVEETEEVTEEVIEPEEVVEEQTEEETVETAEEETAEEATEEVVEEQPAEEVSEPVVIVTEQTVTEEEDDNDEEVVEEFSYDDLAGEGEGGVDFANMMRYNRSFIARIIQGTDEQKTYYGEVRNALLSYKKVNSNIAWGAERFHKGRETIARFKIRGKTLILYLALDPATHEYSVYHHKDVSDNKSVAGTPMMIKVKSPLGVKKAIRLIDEMLAARNGEKRNIPQRDYAAMYPYETIEELIEDGLVKDVRKDNK